MHTPSRATLTLILLGLSLLPGCGGRIMRLQVAGVRFQLLVDEDVDSSLHDSPRDIETDSVIGQVLGEDLLLDDGELWLGTQYLGAVSDGSTIEILPTGVHVNGEFRGGLPYPHMRPASMTFPLE